MPKDSAGCGNDLEHGRYSGFAGVRGFTGAADELESTPDPDSALWVRVDQGSLTNLMQVFDRLIQTNQPSFYRVRIQKF